jgi:hypothetical protein
MEEGNFIDCITINEIDLPIIKTLRLVKFRMVEIISVPVKFP